MIEHIEELRDAVTVAHKCSAKHVDSVPIVEMMGSDIVWEGVVEVFEIEGNPNSDRCYAWTFQDGGKKRFVTVLNMLPVVSAHTALRAAIATGQQK